MISDLDLFAIVSGRGSSVGITPGTALPITKLKNRALSETRFLPEHQNHNIAYDDYSTMMALISIGKSSN